MLFSPHDGHQDCMSNGGENKENPRVCVAFNEGDGLEADVEGDDEETSSTLSNSTDDGEINSDVEENPYDEKGGDEDEELRDDMDIISSDEEMDNEIVPTLTTSFNTENISNILYKCRKVINIINKSSILYEITQKLARPAIKCQLSIDMRIRWHTL